MTRVARIQHVYMSTKCIESVLGSRMFSEGAKDHVFYTQRDQMMTEDQITKEIHTQEAVVKEDLREQSPLFKWTQVICPNLFPKVSLRSLYWSFDQCYQQRLSLWILVIGFWSKAPFLRFHIAEFYILTLMGKMLESRSVSWPMKAQYLGFKQSSFQRSEHLRAIGAPRLVAVQLLSLYLLCTGIETRTHGFYLLVKGNRGRVRIPSVVCSRGFQEKKNVLTYEEILMIN